jgi:hypothetical protein
MRTNNNILVTSAWRNVTVALATRHSGSIPANMFCLSLSSYTTGQEPKGSNDRQEVGR